ncbi:hypothetical protein JCM3774_000047 [Rhodotorula dairenensis]
MSSVEQIASTLSGSSSGSSTSPTASSGALRLVWWIVRCVPWYLWLALAIWAYTRLHQSAGTKVEARRSRRAVQASEAAPRRPAANPKQAPRSASPHIGSGASTPQLIRRNSYARSAEYGRSQTPEMAERGNRNPASYSASHSTSSYSPAPETAAASQSRPSYSTGSLPQVSSSRIPMRRAPSSSSLRNEYSLSEPPPPSSARKRGHGDGDEDGGNGVKRSKLNEGYTFDDSDDEATPMELDKSAQSRDPKWREDSSDQTVRSDVSSPKRPKNTAPRQAAQSSKKRRASPSPSLSGSEDEAPRQGQKKARTSGRGAGAMRDKRGIEDVSFEHEEGEEGSDAEAAHEGRRQPRNADSDVSEDEGEEASESTEQTVASDSRPSGTRAQVKRFRGRAERSGTDDDDLMGDDLDAETDAMLSPPPPRATPAKKSLTTPAKKRLSSRAAASARKGAAKLASSATKKAARRLSTSSSTPRKIGEEWTNYEGDRYRIDEDGQQRRLVEVREVRRKYKLPADSKHPDAKATHEVIVERWVTGDEYAALFEQRKLAWQTSREEEEREKARVAAADPADGDSNMRDAEPASSSSVPAKERGIYYTAGVGTPLRTHAGLASRVSSPSSLQKASNSPSAYSSLASGRLRLPSSASNSRLAALAAGSPARAWSTSQAKRLVEDEEAARAERERRRKASIMLGGEEEVHANETVEPEAKKQRSGTEEAKIKLADYGLVNALPFAVTEKKAEPSASLAPPQPPAATTTPAPAVAPAAASVTAASAAPKTAVPNFFGGLGGAANKQTSTEAATKAPAAPSPSPFSFGSKPVEAAAIKAPADSNSSAGTTESSKAPFSFGAPPAATPASSGSAVNATSVPSETKKAEAPAPSFSFGAAPAPATSSAAPKSGGFSFGAAPATSTAPISQAGEAPKAGFSFGAPSAAAPPQPKADAAPSPFSFGASPASGASQPEAAKSTAASSFSFGAPVAAADPKPAASNVPSFGFGSSAPAAAPTSTAATAPSPFSFGAPSTSTPAAAASANQGGTSAPVGGFSFGAAAQSAAPTQGGFSFGSQPASTTPTPGTAPTTPGFAFGAPATAAGAVPSGGFSFGAPAAPTGGAAPLFSPGLPGGDDNATATPRRRPIRRMPGR